jgi:uncharacterized protein (TIRG00374 family)
VSSADDPPPQAAVAQVPAESPRSKRSGVRTLVAVLGYVAIAALAVRTIDGDRFLDVLARLTIADVGSVVLLVGVHLAMRAFRYHALALRAGAERYRLVDGARIFLLGLGASAVTPARAGDLVKAELLKEHGVRRSVGLGLVVVERVLDLLVVTAAIVVTGALLANKSNHLTLQAAAAVLLALLFAGTVALSVRRWREAAVTIAARAVSRVIRAVRPERLQDIVARIFDVWDEVFASFGALSRFLAISSVAWLADFVKLWVLLRATGANVDLLTVLFVYPVSLIAGILSLLPFSEGVVGVAAVALLTRLAGVDVEVATAAVAVDRAISTLSPIAAYSLIVLGQSIVRRRREK